MPLNIPTGGHQSVGGRRKRLGKSKVAQNPYKPMPPIDSLGMQPARKGPAGAGTGKYTAGVLPGGPQRPPGLSTGPKPGLPQRGPRAALGGLSGKVKRYVGTRPKAAPAGGFAGSLGIVDAKTSSQAGALQDYRRRLGTATDQSGRKMARQATVGSAIAKQQAKAVAKRGVTGFNTGLKAAAPGMNKRVAQRVRARFSGQPKAPDMASKLGGAFKGGMDRSPMRVTQRQAKRGVYSAR